MRFSREPLTFLFVSSLMLCQSAVYADSTSRADLPDGVYEYLGPNPGVLPPKHFVINSDGSVVWSETKESGKSSPPDTNGAVGAETYQYPFVKWKGKRLMGSAKAAGFLTTTYENNALQYQIQVQVDGGLFSSGGGFEKAAKRQGFAVEFLDGNGFKIAEFIIPGSVVHIVQEGSVLQGKGAVQFPEALYEKAKDITIR